MYDDERAAFGPPFCFALVNRGRECPWQNPTGASVSGTKKDCSWGSMDKGRRARAQDAAAQAEVERYLVKQIEAQEVVDRLIRLLDGPRQREVQRRAPEALAKG